MSQSTTATKHSAWRGRTSDEHVLAQVEKWMATIREMSGEPAGLVEALIESARPDRD
jgi:hypothetical protein